jgi:hypothetical protein
MYDYLTYVYMYFCMCNFLALEGLDGFYLYSVFKSVFILSRFPVNLNIPGPKTETLQLCPKT